MKNVGYKHSTQKFRRNILHEIHTSRIAIVERHSIPKLRKFNYIIIKERGKERVITPIAIADRKNQKVVCDQVIIPLMERTLIYDNGASRIDKGVVFARERLMDKLRHNAKLYKNNFYVLRFDVKSYFDTIPHKLCEESLDELINDKTLVSFSIGSIKLYKHAELLKRKNILSPEEYQREKDIIDNCESRGICLGSQISQCLALLVLNPFDHYIKDYKGIKDYIRYMDDGIIISDDKASLNKLKDELEDVIKSLGFTFNKKKTKISKVSKGFTFLKVNYKVLKTGKILRTVSPESTSRMRRKLKKYVKLVNNNKMNLNDVYNSYQSWVSIVESSAPNSHTQLKNMRKLYAKLFHNYGMTKYERKARKNKERKHYEVLQNSRKSDFYWRWNNIRPTCVPTETQDNSWMYGG